MPPPRDEAPGGSEVSAVILGAARTPIGAFLGGLAPISAPQLGSIAIKCALERAGVKPDQVDEVFMGNVVQAGVGHAPGRPDFLGAGRPDSAPGPAVNNACGAGLDAGLGAAPPSAGAA